MRLRDGQGFDFPLTLLLAAAAVLGTTTACGAWWVADLDKIAAGQWWRVALGPLVHANLSHLVRDLAVCLLLGALYEPAFQGRQRWRFAGLLLGGLVGPTLAVMVLHPQLRFYYGLSGLAHALIVMAILHELRRAEGRPPWYVIAVTLGVLAKLLYEALTGSLLFPMSLGAGVQPVVIAHLAGAVTGGLLSLSREGELTGSPNDRPAGAWDRRSRSGRCRRPLGRGSRLGPGRPS